MGKNQSYLNAYVFPSLKYVIGLMFYFERNDLWNAGHPTVLYHIKAQF